MSYPRNKRTQAAAAMQRAAHMITARVSFVRRCMPAILAVAIFATSTIFGATTPTPTPAIITATSTVRFHFDAAAVQYNATGYEFFDKIGNVYVKRGATSATPVFDVPNIGKVPRTFGVRAISAAGPGVMTDITFPGAMVGAKYYVEILMK